MLTSGPMGVDRRGSQPSGSRIQRRSMTTKIAVTSVELDRERNEDPGKSRTRSLRRPPARDPDQAPVMATLCRQDLHVDREQLGPDQPPAKGHGSLVAAVARGNGHRVAEGAQDRDFLVLAERSAATGLLVLEPASAGCPRAR